MWGQSPFSQALGAVLGEGHARAGGGGPEPGLETARCPETNKWTLTLLFTTFHPTFHNFSSFTARNVTDMLSTTFQRYRRNRFWKYFGKYRNGFRMSKSIFSIRKLVLTP